MKRIEIDVDSKDRLTLRVCDAETDQELKKLTGRKCYPFIEKVCNGKVKNIYYLNPTTPVLVYTNYYIDVYEYEQVLRKHGTKPIVEDLEIINNIKNIKEIKKEKVKRKNKYVKKKIITTTLGALVLTSVATGIGFSKSKSAKIENTIPIELELELDDFIEEEIEQEEVVETKDDTNDITVNISYEDRSSTTKALSTKENYGALISKYSKQYGLNEKIMTAIATQERGVHSEIKDKGGATGLMQIQNGVWAGNKLTAYNYNTKSLETITVDEKKLSNLDYNIKVGCMIFQNNVKEMNNNILAAVQCYNLGSANMNKILRAYSKETGRSVQVILSDINDNGWMNYRSVIKVGDPNYVEHVLSWAGSDFTINGAMNNGEVINLNINNQNQTKKY